MGITINIIVPPCFDLGPNVLQQLGAKIVDGFDDLQADLDTKLADLQASGEQTTGVIVAALDTKHQQVMAAVTKLQNDLQAALGQATDPASFQRFKDTMGTSIDQLKTNLQTKQDQIVAAIQGIDQPDQPTGTGTGTDAGTGTGTGTDTGPVVLPPEQAPPAV
jgi:hypothetical protein